jgi:hypothetical protein
MADSDQSLNYVEEACSGPPNPRPKERNSSCSNLRARGPEPRSRAGALWPSTAVPRRPGYRVDLMFTPRHPKWEAL